MECPSDGMPYDFATVSFRSVQAMPRNHYGDEYYLPFRWNNGRAQLTPHWTPDGSAIVFGHQGRIYVIDANGSDLRSLSGSFEPAYAYSEGNDIDFSPALSPDGCRVAYTTLRYAEGAIRVHTYEIASQAIDGSDRRRLTRNNWDDVSPAWSTDGSRIAFVSQREDGLRVFTMASDGSDEHGVAPLVEAQTDPPVWSPDGSRLAFVGEHSEIVSLEWVDGYDGPVTTTDNYKLRREAIYIASPDGESLSKLAWSDAPGAPPRVRKGASTLPIPEEDVTGFQWSPDGRSVAFSARYYGESDKLYVARSDGTEVKRVFDPSAIPESGLYESGLYTRAAISNIIWTDDGSTMSLVVSGYVKIRDTLRPVISVYTVAVDGSEVRLVVDKQDSEDYRKRPDGLVGSGPAQIILRSGAGPNLPPEISGWIVSTIAWDESEEKVLVRTAGGRLVPAWPDVGDAAETAQLCADDRIVPDAEENPGLVNDCRVLMAIRDSLAGSEVLYWSADAPIQEWAGIVVAGEPPRVHALNSVLGVQLNGTISPEISGLTELRTLNLEGNVLHGSIPPELGNLENLEFLDLGGWSFGYNHLTGNIPPELGNLSNLRYLDLRGNGFDGEIPAELGNLLNLKELHLGDNPLQGQIPAALGNLSKLVVLYLGGNRSELTGTIPPELGNLRNLRSLRISWTQLSGSIPPELGNLSQLRVLALPGGAYNEGGLTGAIPPELAKLERLNSLNLENNRLEGSIPQEFGNWVREREDGGYSTSLSYMNLSGNLLEGCIPAKMRFIRGDIGLPLCE